MTKRGKVLREPTSGPGLLMMEGQQYRFSRDVWRSEVPPKAGLVVDVELDTQGGVQAATVVPDSQLTREQAEASMVLARPKGLNMPSSLITRIGLIRLATAGPLAAAWFFPTAVSVQVPFPERLEFTFWQLLGFLQPGNVPGLLDGHGSPGAGLYGLVAIVALAGPFLHHFWKDKRAFIGGLLPLAFMIVVGFAVRHSLQTALGGSNDGTYAVPWNAVSFGLGAYLSILLSLYFAFMSAQSLVAARVTARQQTDLPQRKAA